MLLIMSVPQVSTTKNLLKFHTTSVKQRNHQPHPEFTDEEVEAQEVSDLPKVPELIKPRL